MNGQNGSVAGWSFQRILAWISANERARRRAAKRALRKAPPPRSRRISAWLGTAFLAGAIGLSNLGTAWAATYHVGTGQTYADLETLRKDGLTNSTLNPGDVVILHNDDNSLTQGFVFATGAGGTLVFNTLGENRTISYAGAVNQGARLFLDNSATGSGALTITLDKVTLDGFSTTTNSQAGSMIYSSAPLTVIGDLKITHSGTINPNNIINSGDPGPIRVNNRVTFTGNVVFDGNLGGWSSGLALYAGSNTSNIAAEFMQTAQFINNFNLNTGQPIDGALNSSSGKDIVFYDTVLFNNNRASGNNP